MKRGGGGGEGWPREARESCENLDFLIPWGKRYRPLCGKRRVENDCRPGGPIALGKPVGGRPSPLATNASGRCPSQPLPKERRGLTD